MNNIEQGRLLKGYPVTVCAADQLKTRRGSFVIANTDTLGGPGTFGPHFTSLKGDRMNSSILWENVRKTTTLTWTECGDGRTG